MSKVCSFNIKKFSKYVLSVPEEFGNIPVNTPINTWYHFPQRSSLMITFVVNNGNIGIYVYFRGERLEKVYLEPFRISRAVFMTKYPAVGFKLTDEKGKTVSRFQVSFEEKNTYDKLIEFLEDHNLIVNEVAPKETPTQNISNSIPVVSEFILPSQNPHHRTRKVVNEESLQPESKKQIGSGVRDTPLYPTQISQLDAVFPNQLEGSANDLTFGSIDYQQPQTSQLPIHQSHGLVSNYVGHQFNQFTSGLTIDDNLYNIYSSQYPEGVTPNTSIMSQIQEEILNSKSGKIDKGVQTKEKISKKSTDLKKMDKAQIKDYVKELLSDQEFVETIEMLENALFGS